MPVHRNRNMYRIKRLLCQNGSFGFTRVRKWKSHAWSNETKTIFASFWWCLGYGGGLSMASWLIYVVKCTILEIYKMGVTYVERFWILFDFCTYGWKYISWDELLWWRYASPCIIELKGIKYEGVKDTQCQTLFLGGEGMDVQHLKKTPCPNMLKGHTLMQYT